MLQMRTDKVYRLVRDHITGGHDMLGAEDLS